MALGTSEQASPFHVPLVINGILHTSFVPSGDRSRRTKLPPARLVLVQDLFDWSTVSLSTRIQTGMYLLFKTNGFVGYNDLIGYVQWRKLSVMCFDWYGLMWVQLTITSDHRERTISVVHVACILYGIIYSCMWCCYVKFLCSWMYVKGDYVQELTEALGHSLVLFTSLEVWRQKFGLYVPIIYFKNHGQLQTTLKL